MTRPLVKGAKAQIRCKPVMAFDDELRKLIRDMKHTMIVHDGAGLAAPQVGVALRVFVFEQAKGQIGTMVNPQILQKVGRVGHYEGCLSDPRDDARYPKERAERIVVRAQSPTGHGYTVAFTGKPAQVIQHEVDHLDGVTVYP